MWKKLPKTQYFIRFTNTLELYLTDFITLWYKTFSTTSFLGHLKESNSDMEGIDEMELIDKGKQMLTNPNDLNNVDIKIEGTSMTVFITVLYGYPVILELKLEEGCKELYFQKVTQPLLRTVQDLRLSQHELRTLLQSKDTEIEKSKNGTVSGYWKTEPFNVREHMNKHNVYECHFGNSDIPDELLEKVVKAVTVNNEVDVKQVIKHEPEESATEPIVKMESQIDVKQETIKIEPDIPSQTTLISPRKRLKRRLNI